jgi:hypothetical protein
VGQRGHSKSRGLLETVIGVAQRKQEERKT